MTQNAQILNHLKRKPITPIEALQKFGCFRLGARVWELRQQGHPITKRTVERNGKRFAEYKLN
jgi:hypothetical protein